MNPPVGPKGECDGSASVPVEKRFFCRNPRNWTINTRVFLKSSTGWGRRQGGTRVWTSPARVLELKEYSRHHFTEEENWLKIIGFPGLQHQEKQHAFFISQVTDLQDRYSKGDGSIPISTLEVLRDWLLSHILENDKKYGTFMHEVRE